MIEEDAEQPQVIAYRDRIPLDRPWLWLARGWADFRRAPHVGLVYGFAIVLASWGAILLVAAAGYVYLLLPLTGGFFILAPLLVAGLYDTSRRLEEGQKVTIFTALFSWRAAGQLALMGMLLLLIHLFWIRIALFIYPLFLPAATPSWDRLPDLILNASLALVVGSAIGAVLALAAYALTAISVPMLVDRDVSVVEAAVASCVVVRRNLRAMLLWAAIILVATVIGMSTMFVGLAIVVPVLAHATWHAYRDAVDLEAIP